MYYKYKEFLDGLNQYFSNKDEDIRIMPLILNDRNRYMLKGMFILDNLIVLSISQNFYASHFPFKPINLPNVNSITTFDMLLKREIIMAHDSHKIKDIDHYNNAGLALEYHDRDGSHIIVPVRASFAANTIALWEKT